MHKKILFTTALFLLTLNIYSQTEKFRDTGTVKNQFDYLITKSNKFQDYKVVKLNWLHKLKSNVSDSLSGYKKEIIANYETINSQKKSIDSLKNELANSEGEISSLNNEIDSISLFGIQFNKTFFKTLLFLIIGTLAILLVFFITKFKQSNSITKQAKNDLKEVEEEFETHRKVALEREQKVRRQLQDELNKQKKD